MSYEDYEGSIASARPVRLYLFERGNTGGSAIYWAYTNADRDMVLDGYNYRQIAIDDDGIRQTGEPTNDMLKVTMPSTSDIANMFKATQPSDEIWLTIREVDFNEPQSALIVWVGSIAQVAYPREDTAEVNCASLEASLQRNLLKRTYNRNCDYAIYSADCGLNKAHYAIAATVVAMDGQAITCSMASPPTRSLNYGIVEWPSMNGLATETRGIDYVDGNGRIILIGGTGGLKIGQSVTLYPGCDQSSATCNNVFNNMLNYGGFRHLPGKSPFDGDPIM